MSLDADHPPASRTADVVVVGAGLSGLVAARRLLAAGVEDVVVLDARDRPGGRLDRIRRPGGRTFEAGGEFLGPACTRLIALGAELGLRRIPVANAAAPEGGACVRLFAGERLVEREPLDTDATAAAAYRDAVARLDALAAALPAEAPWDAPDARELDAQTLHVWLAANVPNAAAREALRAEFDYFGADYAELSLLFALAFIRGCGGFEAWAGMTSERFEEGPSALVDRLVAELGDRVVLSAPVRRIERDADGVVAIADALEVRARAVVVATSPALCERIDFSPALPPARARLQARWCADHALKHFAVYERPWWRERGLAGVGTGAQPFSVVLDVSPPDGSEGVLCAFAPATGATTARHGDVLGDAAKAQAAFRAAIEACFPGGPEPLELHGHSWFGDRWSAGCASGLAPGTLSSVGPALRERVGRIVWAGAETGAPQIDYMEGAVSAAERAARETMEILNG